jgi:hypothetical protein
VIFPATGACALLVCAAAAAGDVACFTSASSFAAFASDRGAFATALEDFEEAALEAGKTPFPDPLLSGIFNSPVFPNGLAAPGLAMQTNRLPGPLAPLDVPSGNAQALFAVAAGAIGTNSVKVGEDLGILFGIHCSIDILFEADNVHAVGLEQSRFAGFGAAGWHIGIFDADDNLIGNYLRTGPVAAEPAKNFFGVWSSTPIARINLFDLSVNPSPDAVDNIEVWVPSPGAAALLTLVLVVRRRRV